MTVSVACAQQDVSEKTVNAGLIYNTGKDLLREKKLTLPSAGSPKR
ncbi:hypothetical protein ACTJJB_12515 [Chitinophaga sp. 22536]